MMEPETVYCVTRGCEADEGHGCTGHTPRHLIRAYSDRGFARYPTITEPYQGVDVDVYESSAASEPALWLSLRRTDALGDDNLAAHLMLEQATVLAEQLQHAIEHHYQKDGG